MQTETAMKLTFTRNRLTPLGVSIGPSTASVVQLSGATSDLELRTAVQCSWNVPAGADDETTDQMSAESLRVLVGDHRLRGRSVVSCLRSDELFVETVRLPHLPPEEVAKAIRWEAAERMGIPVDDVEARYLIAGEVRQENTPRQEIILMACHKSLIRRRLKVLESAGLVPVSLDVEPCAVLRSALRSQGTAEPARLAYLYCSETGTTVMFADGSRITFLKSIPIGGQQFNQAISQTLGIDQAIAQQMRADVFAARALDGENEIHRSIIEALRSCFEQIIDEIELCLRYHKVTFRGRPLEGLVMTGSESAPWLGEYFCERVGIPCRSVSPLLGISGVTSQGSVQQRYGRWAMPLGLALKRQG